jgi:hypothetical protein
MHDIEDVIVPEEGGLDDFVKEMADVLSGEGIAGTFNLIGDKVRLWQKRGRGDVIAALARHDIGSHTSKGTSHPTVFEYLEDKNWEDGIRECEKRERAYFDELSAVFHKKNPHYASHITVGDPAQFMCFLKNLGKACVFSCFNIPEYPRRRAVWYCGALNFCGYEGDGLEQSFFDDQIFERRMARLLEDVQKNASEGVDYCGFFVGHDMMKCQTYTDRFWGANGVNLPRRQWGKWGLPALKSDEDMRRMMTNYRKFARALKSNGHLRLSTIEELSDLYRHQRSVISSEELYIISQKILEREQIIMSDFSPAETTLALAESLLAYAKNKQLPGKVRVRETLGPMDTFVGWPEPRGIEPREVIALCRELMIYHQKHGALAHQFAVRGLRVGINSFYHVLAQMYAACFNGKSADVFSLRAEMRKYPAAAYSIESIMTRQGDCLLYKPDLNMHTICKYLKLQTWTLKPACQSSESGEQ